MSLLHLHLDHQLCSLGAAQTAVRCVMTQAQDCPGRELCVLRQRQNSGVWTGQLLVC